MLGALSQDHSQLQMDQKDWDRHSGVKQWGKQRRIRERNLNETLV